MRACVLVLLSACFNTHFGIGVMQPMNATGQPPRDPSPTADPTKQQTQNPWREGPPSAKQIKFETNAAVFLAILMGWTPMLMWYGSFDENRIAPKHHHDDEDAPTASPRP